MPVYEEKEKTNGQKRYFIRTYITDEFGKRKQITRHSKNWIGRDGYWLAYQEESKIKSKIISTQKNASFTNLVDLFYKEKYNKVKESTYISYKEVIKNQLFPALKNKIIDYDVVLEWHQQMEKSNLSIRYLNKINAVLKSMLDVGIKYRIFERNYVKDIGNFKTKIIKEPIQEEKIKYIKIDEFNKFIKVIDDKMWYSVFYLLYFTGVRKGELLALTWGDIDFNANKIKINKTYTDRTENGNYKITATKNYKNREIEIDTNTKNVIKEWYDFSTSRFNINANSFVFGNDRPISTTTMTNKKNFYFKKAGFDEPFITIHEFRHSHVSLLINEYLKSGNKDMTKFFLMMSNRMGHTIQVMQETYMHLFPDTQETITNLLNNLNKQDQKQDQEK